MRRLLLAAAVLSSAACFAPRPCTRALCPAGVDGAYRVSGWNSSVSVDRGAPAVPIVSDSEVQVTDGSVAFVNGTAVVRASAGAAFHFELAAPPSEPYPVIKVSSGSVTVSLSSGSVQTVAPGAAVFLPVAR